MLVQLRSGNSTLEITLGESHEIPFEKMSPSSISDTNNVQQWLTSNPSPNKKNKKVKLQKGNSTLDCLEIALCENLQNS